MDFALSGSGAARVGGEAGPLGRGESRAQGGGRSTARRGGGKARRREGSAAPRRGGSPPRRGREGAPREGESGGVEGRAAACRRECQTRGRSAGHARRCRGCRDVSAAGGG